MDNCKNCGEPTMSDGHGELIHTDDDDRVGTYGCHPGDKKAKNYPVAA